MGAPSRTNPLARIKPEALIALLVGTGLVSAENPLPVSIGSDISLAFDGEINVGQVSFDQTTPGTTNGVVVNASALPAGAATQTTSAAILAKLSADPATQTTLAALLAKVIAAPSTEAKQDALATLVTATNALITALSAKVTACNTGSVTIASSVLPTGAATAAKQPALGTAGTASADVLSVQGIAGGTAMPISGTITNTPAALTRGASAAYEASKIIKASAGSLYALMGYNSGPAQFIQLFDSASLPANGVAPILVIGVPAQSSFAFNLGGFAIPHTTGIVVSNSSTGPTKTIGSADCYFTALYI